MRQTPDDPVSIVKDLREHMLTIPAAEMAGAAGNDQPFAVATDITTSGTTTTIFVTSSGDGSIYTSNGGALLGGVGKPEVRSAAIDAVRQAEEHKGQYSAVSQYPYPPEGKVKFYVRTRAGVYAAERTLDALKSGTDPLSPLYLAVEQVRERMEKYTKVQPGHIYSISPPPR